MSHLNTCPAVWLASTNLDAVIADETPRSTSAGRPSGGPVSPGSLRAAASRALIALALLLGFACGDAQAAVAMDAVNSSFNYVSTLTFSHTVGAAGTNRLLLV